MSANHDYLSESDKDNIILGVTRSNEIIEGSNGIEYSLIPHFKKLGYVVVDEWVHVGHKNSTLSKINNDLKSVNKYKWLGKFEKLDKNSINEEANKSWLLDKGNKHRGSASPGITMLLTSQFLTKDDIINKKFNPKELFKVANNIKKDLKPNDKNPISKLNSNSNKRHYEILGLHLRVCVNPDKRDDFTKWFNNNYRNKGTSKWYKELNEFIGSYHIEYIDDTYLEWINQQENRAWRSTIIKNASKDNIILKYVIKTINNIIKAYGGEISIRKKTIRKGREVRVYTPNFNNMVENTKDNKLLSTVCNERENIIINNNRHTTVNNLSIQKDKQYILDIIKGVGNITTKDGFTIRNKDDFGAWLEDIRAMDTYKHLIIERDL